MSDVPAAMPVTILDDEPIVATVVVVLVHAPPVAGSLSKLVLPIQTVNEPVIAPGEELTEIIFVT
jgi:hypothetical protein